MTPQQLMSKVKELVVEADLPPSWTFVASVTDRDSGENYALFPNTRIHGAMPIASLNAIMYEGVRRIHDDEGLESGQAANERDGSANPEQRR